MLFKPSSPFFVSVEELKKSGITYDTRSNGFNSNVVSSFNKMADFRPICIPPWVDFNNTIPCDISRKSENYVSFPIFTKKVAVFDGSIASDIIALDWYQLLEGDEERDAFFVNKSQTDLFVDYWNSYFSVDDFLAKQPYSQPHVFVFEPIPSMLLCFNL